MDSWNIFSRNFWTLRNLFGQSACEARLQEIRIIAEARLIEREHFVHLQQQLLALAHREEAQFQQLKVTRLTEASAAVESGDETALRNPVTMEIIENPVITTRGGVYDRDSLAECLRHMPKDPLTNLPITQAQIRPFPEFKIHIDAFHQKRQAEAAAARQEANGIRSTLAEQVSAYPFGLTYAVYSGICAVLSSGYSAVSAIGSYCNPMSFFGRVVPAENVSQALRNEYQV